jgi:hypothetical protein
LPSGWRGQAAGAGGLHVAALREPKAGAPRARALVDVTWRQFASRDGIADAPVGRVHAAEIVARQGDGQRAVGFCSREHRTDHAEAKHSWLHCGPAVSPGET